MAGHQVDNHTELNQTEARQGFRGFHVLTVLIGALVLAAIAWVGVSYFIR
jgi:hypothetical protein